MNRNLSNSSLGSICNLDHAMSLSISSLLDGINYMQTDSCQDNDALRNIFDKRDCLPKELIRSVNDFKYSHTSYMRINGLPREKYSEVLLLVSSLLGVPFCHNQESSLVSVVKPKREAGETEISYYTWNKFALHSELPYVKSPPDFLVLLCKNNVPNGFTYTACVDSAVRSLSQEDIDLLLLPDYQVVIPPHFNHAELYAPLRPILEKVGEHYRVRIRFDDIRCMTERHESAVERLFRALDEVKRDHFLNSGEMLIINNNASLHGRNNFKPRFDDNDRELYRVYIYSDCTKVLSGFDFENKRISGF